MLVRLVLVLGSLVGTVLLAYFVLGLLGYLLYRPETASEPAENVRFVVPTVGADHVRDSLLECLDHHRDRFSDYTVYCLTDEGADLEAELRALDGVETVVVPDDYDCDAVAKGRAIQYFIDTVVADAPDYWYSFIDDDNLVRDDRFLYEIPVQEAKGRGAMNAVLSPRRGDSTVTYIMDHIRLLDDLTVFRAFTGLFGRPYIGFHGELLTARGDVLLDVGFDRETIVEDFAFAAELVRNDVRTWQSRTRVSILSPHTLEALFEQRSRWFIGTWNLLWSASPVTRALTGLRFSSWVCAIVAGPLGTLLWYSSGGVALPDVLELAPTLAGVVYGGTYLYGVGRVGGSRWPVLALALPLYAVFEALSPIYAVLFSGNEFTVIEK
ncbi:glycosyltransferase family 2 protein [Halobaculum sp. D14]|uniref:glycosyltransferase family 2 protein n=1 Tax=unclassified Halobaculum TaxID=2640896 RepID=UPI003EBC1382